jgi:hypothetical protein
LFRSVNLPLKEQEDHYRRLFAQARHDPAIQDPHLMLIDAFERRDQFVVQPWSDTEDRIPKIAPTPSAPVFAVGTNCIVTKDEFMKNWEILTNGQFKGLDWSNLFVAGGCILACLFPGFEANMQSPGFKATDIDMFIYGLSPEQANAKLRHIYDVLKTNNGKIGFDVDACCVGFDGSRVWVHQRAHRSMVKRYNLVDMSRRSLTYESRLNKYRKRGFYIAIPTLDRQRVSSTLFSKKASDVEGLAKPNNNPNRLVVDVQVEGQKKLLSTNNRLRRKALITQIF